MAAELQPDWSVVLQYRRVGELSTGRIALMPTQSSDETAHCLEDFDKLSFAKMLTRFARELRAHPDAKASILRIDRPGLLPYALDAETTRLFREDPVTAIRSMMYEARTLTAQQEDPKPLEATPVRVCHDTLADAFGELVYTRCKDSNVECPGCGYWGPSRGDSFTCTKKCAVKGQAVELHLELSKLWAGIRVEALLSSPLTKFFLPRPWNLGQAWISREELAKRYDEYKTEKEDTWSAIMETEK